MHSKEGPDLAGIGIVLMSDTEADSSGCSADAFVPKGSDLIPAPLLLLDAPITVS